MSVQLSIAICAVFLAHFCLSSEPDLIWLTAESSDYAKPARSTEEFTILCYKRSPEEDNYYFSDTWLEINFESDNFDIYEGSDENDVIENFRSDNIWDLDNYDGKINKVVKKITNKRTKYCLGINTKTQYSAKLNCVGFFWLFFYISVLPGLVLVLSICKPKVIGRKVSAFGYALLDLLDSVKSFRNLTDRRVFNFVALGLLILLACFGNSISIIFCILILIYLLWRACFHLRNMTPIGDEIRSKNMLFYFIVYLFIVSPFLFLVEHDYVS